MIGAALDPARHPFDPAHEGHHDLSAQDRCSYSDGGIAPGTSDHITGGVLTVYRSHVDMVRNRGPVTTYGVNDMVLVSWGTVDR
jgi:hypothetical protein